VQVQKIQSQSWVCPWPFPAAAEAAAAEVEIEVSAAVAGQKDSVASAEVVRNYWGEFLAAAAVGHLVAGRFPCLHAKKLSWFSTWKKFFFFFFK